MLKMIAGIRPPEAEYSAHQPGIRSACLPHYVGSAKLDDPDGSHKLFTVPTAMVTLQSSRKT